MYEKSEISASGVDINELIERLNGPDEDEAIHVDVPIAEQQVEPDLFRADRPLTGTVRDHVSRRPDAG